MIVAIDLETTGLDKINDKITEVALIKYDEETNKIIDTFQTLVNPKIKIPPIITKITHITDNDVAGAPLISDLKDKIQDFIWDLPILWHNTTFDVTFLRNNGIEIENNIILDTFFLANFLIIWWTSLSLDYLSLHFSFSHESAHRAYDDAFATIQLFNKLKELYCDLSQERKCALSFIFSRSTQQNVTWFWKWLKIECWISAENFTSSVLENIWWNLEDDLDNIFNEQIKETIKWYLDSFLSSSKNTYLKGPLFQDYSAELVVAVSELAQTKKQKILIVSDKLSSNAVTWKGGQIVFSKNKYVSLFRFFEFIINWNNLSENETSFILKIANFLFETTDWVTDALNFYGPELNFLQKITSDHPIVLDIKKNPFFKSEFLHIINSKIEENPFLVIHKDSYFLELKKQAPIFWEASTIILDWMYDLEDKISSAFEEKLNPWKIKQLISMTDTKDFAELLAFLDEFEEKLKQYYNDKSSTWRTIILLQSDFFDNYLLKAQEIIKLLEVQMFCANWKISDIDYIHAERYNNYCQIKNNLWFLSNLFSQWALKNKIYKILISEGQYVLVWTLLHPWNYLQETLEKYRYFFITNNELSEKTLWYYQTMLSIPEWNNKTLETANSQLKMTIINNLWNPIREKNKYLHYLQTFLGSPNTKSLFLFTSYNNLREYYLSLWWIASSLGVKLYAQTVWWNKKKLLRFFEQEKWSAAFLWTQALFDRGASYELFDRIVIFRFPLLIQVDPIVISRSKLFEDWTKDYSLPKSSLRLTNLFPIFYWKSKRLKEIILLDNRFGGNSWNSTFKNTFWKEIITKIECLDFSNLNNKKR